MDHTNVAIIGCGVIGLAIGAEVSKKRGVVLIERHGRLGTEISSRNSEIIHSGIYYNKDSLKARLCLEGNRLLYDICKINSIDHRKIGKLVVATSDTEIGELEKLIEKGKNNDVQDLSMLTEVQVRSIEPNIKAVRALLVPSAGVVDVHQLMNYYEKTIVENNGVIALNSLVFRIGHDFGKYTIEIKGATRDEFYTLTCNVLINAAGLGADKIAEMVGIDVGMAGYKIHYCKGEYFIVNNSNGKVNHLIYPIPEKKLVGLGIHTSLDLAGGLRLGPNAFYVNDIDYDVDENHRNEFYEYVRLYLPWLKKEDLQPGFAGIRPKLQGPGEDYRDFVIKHEKDKGFVGLINLIGIESPGLTCSPAIAKYVGKIVEEILF